MASEEDQKKYLRERASTDLLFLFTEAQVSIKLQYDLVSKGYDTLRKFSGLDDSREKVRAALEPKIGLDPRANGARLAAATVVSAWEIAKEHLAKEVQLKAEAKVLNVQRHTSESPKGTS